jgi:hypothetical protein
VSEELVVYRFTSTGVNEVAAAYRTSTKEAEKAAAAELRIRRATAAQIDRIQNRPQRRTGPMTYQDTVRAAQKAADQEVRIQQRAQDQIVNIRRRSYERAMAAQERMAERSASDSQRMLGKVGDRVGGFASGAAKYGVMAGVALTGAAARQYIKGQQVASRMAINASAAGGQAINPKEIYRSFENVSMATPGVSTEQVGTAALAFQGKRGQVLDQERLQVLATAASASGADIVDLSNAMAALNEHMDIKTVDQFKESLSALISQGARGAFELKDAAANYLELSASAGFLGMQKGVAGVRTMGGLTQLAYKGTGSPEEATTALRNVFMKLVQEAPNLKKEGVNVYDQKTGKARNVNEILVETIAKVGGKDMEAKRAGLLKMFDLRAVKAISPLMDAFASATAEGKDGIAAMNEAILNAGTESGNWADRQREAAMAQQDASAQISAAWEKVVQVVGEEVVPGLMPLIDNLPALVDSIVPLIETFADLTDGVLGFLKILPGVDSDKIERREKATKARRELINLEREMAAPSGFMGPLTEEQIAENAEKRKRQEAQKAALQYELETIDAVDKSEAAKKLEEKAKNRSLDKQVSYATGGGAAIGGAFGGTGGAALGAGVGKLAGEAAAQDQMTLRDRGLGALDLSGEGGGMSIAYEIKQQREAAAGAGGKPPEIKPPDTEKVQSAFERVAEAANALADQMNDKSRVTAGSL